MDFAWSTAFTIGGVGFGLVFAVLIALAVIIWVAGRLIRRYYWAKAEVIKLDEAKTKGTLPEGED